jgi:hypothetical protein
LGYRSTVKKNPISKALIVGDVTDERELSLGSLDDKLAADQSALNERIVNAWPDFWESTKLSDFATSSRSSKDSGDFLGCPSIGSHVEVESGTAPKGDN